MRVSNSSVAMTGEIRMSSFDKSKVAETKHKMKVVEFVKIKFKSIIDEEEIDSILREKAAIVNKIKACLSCSRKQRCRIFEDI